MSAANKNKSHGEPKKQERAQSDVKMKFEPDSSLKNINDSSGPQNNEKDVTESTSCCMAPINFLSDFFQIYNFGTCQDKVVMVIAIFLALCSGVAIPLFMYFWGKQLDHLMADIFNLDATMDQSQKYFYAFIGVAVGSFILNAIVFAVWKMLSERIAYQFRVKYMQSFAYRSIGWAEKQNLYETSSKFKNNCLTIQKATGDKVALFYNLLGVATTGIIIAICVRWTFGLFLVGLLPIGMIALGYFIYIMIMRKSDSKQFFEAAEGQAVEATFLIKTVKMLRGEKNQEKIYNNRLDQFKEKIKQYPCKLGISTGLFYFIQYFLFGVGFMFGIQCVRGTSACPTSATGSRYSIGDMHIVFFEAYACSYYFLQIAANYDAIKDAIRSSKDIFNFIKQADEEQAHAHSGRREGVINEEPTSIGDIEFRNVTFAYPTNPSKKILKNLTLIPLKNKFNAIVGTTGSGKSTFTQLLMKTYPPNEGRVLIGGRNIEDVGTGWLREKIGYVGQEPTLFNGTLRENILVGKENATDDQIWDVLREVNMHEFVERQPEKLNYDVGFGGGRLSGGQKQRIAIARALIKKPSLLILDEATSALDRKSEKLVQKTFDKLFTSKELNMTVLCIAHRVRTIVKADRIFYLDGGIVKEQGTFREISYFKDVELPPEQEDEGEAHLQEFVHSSGPAEEEKKVVVVQQQYDGPIYSKLLDYTENKCLYAVGLFFSFLNGLNHPGAILLVAYMYSETVNLTAYGKATSWCERGIPSDCNDVLDRHHQNSVNYMGALIGFSFYSLIPYFIQFYIMTKIEDEITHNLRKEVFKKLMHMPLAWYDKPENEGGQIAGKLGTDVKEASTLVSTYVPIIIGNLTTSIGGIVICLAYLWQLGLLSLYSIPLIAVGGYISMLFIGGYDDETTHKYQRSDKIATEMMINIKTISSLNYQKRMLEKYVSFLENDPVESLKKGAKIGVFFGLSISLIVLAIGSQLFAGDHIIPRIGTAKVIDLTVVITVSMWCGWVAGNSFFFASHAAAGKQSAKRIFKTLDERTEVESQPSTTGKIVRTPPNEIKGRIELKRVSFKYGSKYILKDLSLVIEAGQKAAFVGESGCGKSTVMLLLQRFYDFEGEITLDGINIFDYDLDTYRSYFSILNQEPSLFTGTIRENALFGSDVSEKQLTQACKLAHAYDANLAWKGTSIEVCIQQFLDRDAGLKGSKVSGGEKQRLACARGILKSPRIFLMDEGTSALDPETEKKVQQNIDNKLKGITTVNIAHRFETIENSDVIFMFEEGKVVESGRYGEMMAKKQYFFKFVQGEKYKSFDKIAEQLLDNLVIRLLHLHRNSK